MHFIPQSKYINVTDVAYNMSHSLTYYFHFIKLKHARKRFCFQHKICSRSKTDFEDLAQHTRQKIMFFLKNKN